MMSTMADASARDLRPLFDPRSLAIVGASNDPAKWGMWLARGALRGAHRRDVYLVNRNGGEVLGCPAYRSLAELPGPPELVVVSVPAPAFEETVDGALAAGARAIVAIAAGLGESGEEGLARERAVTERVRDAGAVLLGPNCLGVYDAAAELDLGSSEFAPGPIGLVSQSGNLALEVSLLAEEVGLGVSRFASLGNQADLELAELVVSLAEHEETRAIGVYCEDFRDGRAFARAAATAREAGKPVLLIAGGASPAGERAARSHTGALVSPSVAVDAACRAAGILRVATPKELVEAAQLLLAGARPRGKRLAIVSDGGGSGVVAADLATGLGLELPRLGDDLQRRLAAVMPATATTTNPVDFAGAGEQDLGTYERVPRLLLESGEIDCVFLTGYIGGYGAVTEELAGPETEAARGMARAAADTGRPAVVQTMYWRTTPAEGLREGGVPVYRDVQAALGAIGRAVDFEASPPLRVPDLPAPQAASSEDGYFGARALLAAAGVRFAPARVAAGPAEAVAAAEELGYPVALKALGVLHKSEAGAVVLGLDGTDSLRQALAAMSAPAGYAVEPMVSEPGAVELIVGARTDPRFGPLVLVGLGGVYAEIFGDTAVALAPADADELEELLLSLKAAPLLTGARGRPALAIRAAAVAAAALSRVAAEHPELAELEVNPLLVTREGAVGLDARLVYADPAEA
jgi:acyl-CoA synthetase (NDP forming)